MSQTTVDVTTPRGTMPTYVHRPDGDGPFPRVVLFMDAPGIRPALFGHAKRLAGAGYTAILPDLYYPFDAADRPNAERMAAGDAEEFARMRKLVEQIRDEDVLEDTRLLLGVLCRSAAATAPVGVHRLLHGRPDRDAGGRGVRRRRRRGVAAAPHESGHRRARLPAPRRRSRRCGPRHHRHPAEERPGRMPCFRPSPVLRGSSTSSAGVAYQGSRDPGRRRARLHDAGQGGLRRSRRRGGLGGDARVAARAAVKLSRARACMWGHARNDTVGAQRLR